MYGLDFRSIKGAISSVPRLVNPIQLSRFSVSLSFIGGSEGRFYQSSELLMKPGPENHRCPALN